MTIWDNPQRQDASINWIEQCLANLGIPRSGEYDPFHVRAWSRVIRVPTKKGDFFFKAGASFQEFEAAFLEAARQSGLKNILLPLFVEEERGWIFFADGGKTLREQEQGYPQQAHWEMLLSQYARLQIAMADHSEKWLAAGLPDHRMDRLIIQYHRLLDLPDFKGIAHIGGLSQSDMKRFGDRSSKFETLCAQLEQFQIPASVDHGDLHDANVFYESPEFVFYDWGDASLTHPFISLMIPLRVLGNYLGYEPESHPKLEWARKAYLKVWSDHLQRNDLDEAWNLALHIGRFHRAMTWYKVAHTSQGNDRIESAASFVGWLREFIYHPELPPA